MALRVPEANDSMLLEPLDFYSDEGGTSEYWRDSGDDGTQVVDYSMLSQVAIHVRDNLPKGTHLMGEISYSKAFTGKDLVSAIQSLIQDHLVEFNYNISFKYNRQFALHVARSLRSERFFYEVNYGQQILQDTDAVVYMFPDEQAGGSSTVRERSEPPKGVMTPLTKCYVPSCNDSYTCYAFGCPRKGNSNFRIWSTNAKQHSVLQWPIDLQDEELTQIREGIWETLTKSEENRQLIIQEIISQEERRCFQDLSDVERVFIQRLRNANPPIVPNVEEFIDEVFGKIFNLREHNFRLLEALYLRRREQSPVIYRIGDIFLHAAMEFQSVYPTYVGHIPIAEKRIENEVAKNPGFQRFLEHQIAQLGSDFNLKHLINRPALYLKRLPVILGTVLNETAESSPDAEFLREAIDSIKKLQTVGQLMTFQMSVDKGRTGKWEWHDLVSLESRKSFSRTEAKRQSIIFELIKGEMSYVEDLKNVEYIFIQPLRGANPPIIPPHRLDQWIEDVFNNFAELHIHHLKLLKKLHEIQREQHPLIRSVTAVFFDAVYDWRDVYVEFGSNHSRRTYIVDQEMNVNPTFKEFINQSVRHPDARRLDMKSFISRPIARLSQYILLLNGILEASGREHSEDRKAIPHVINILGSIEKMLGVRVASTKHSSQIGLNGGESIDLDLLNLHVSLVDDRVLLRHSESLLEWSNLRARLFGNNGIDAIHNVPSLEQFQVSRGRGAAGKWEWHDLANFDRNKAISKKELPKRQLIIFELIKNEMTYVSNLENIEHIFIRPLRDANPPVIPHDRLDRWNEDVFHNFAELYYHHLKLLHKFHEIQREQHPYIRSVTGVLLDAALNWKNAYMEYIPNHPISCYKIDQEIATNRTFKLFVNQCFRHPDAQYLDIKGFISLPITRLLRYELLLKSIMEVSEPGHEDRDRIPIIIDVLKSVRSASEPRVANAKQKVERWKYSASLSKSLDVLNPNRSLLHKGELIQQLQRLESGIRYHKLHIILFDDYLVLLEPNWKDDNRTYRIHQRPIPLDLLTSVIFTDPPIHLNGTFQHGSRNHPGERYQSTSTGGSPLVFPITLHSLGRMGGIYTLYAESSASRNKWGSKIEDALKLRSVAQEYNKVFKIKALNVDGFLMPSTTPGSPLPAWNQDTYSGKATCSVPFGTSDGRAMVAIGCAEGVWIGLRHEPESMQRVLSLKMVTQCAVLEDFRIFLVLADKSLLAYHMETLIPSLPHQTIQPEFPQKLNGSKDVEFFGVGRISGRTLVGYMRKKGLDNIFRLLEPVSEKIKLNNEDKASAGLGLRLGRGGAKSEWFRLWREFSWPSQPCFDVVFLKSKLAFLGRKGFEIMNLYDFTSETIPMWDSPQIVSLAKRCETCRPLGMVRSPNEEFLLVYDEFGLYIDRQGHPIPTSGTIDWEGDAERVALHSPYILLFSRTFIEIRHIDTCRLIQIIPGNEIRCICDGRGVISTTPATGGGLDIGARTLTNNSGDDTERAIEQLGAALETDDALIQAPLGGLENIKVHAVMNSSAVRSGGAISQHIFELVPTAYLGVPAGH